MSKYLELFKGSFNDSINEKRKLENKPYIGYSLTEGKVVYTVVPKPVTGPVDNEIWYTSSDGNVINVVIDFETDLSVNGISIISNNYSDGIGVIAFSDILTFIGDRAFKQRETLSSITLPESITSIGAGSFMGCSSLTSFVIPRNVTNIGASAFRDCPSLNDIKFEGSMAEWEAVTKGMYFNLNAPATYVQCSDGQVAL